MPPTNNQSLRSELQARNARLDTRLRTWIGMSANRFKQIKALTELAGMGAIIYAMHLGADPLSALALGVLLIGGPEYLDYVLSTNHE